ncbi:MAG: ankyrin repeat domain-containing protein [Planctomycetota bacterium]
MSSPLPFLLPGVAALALSFGTAGAGPQTSVFQARASLCFVQVELTKFGERQQLDVSGAGYDAFRPPPTPEYYLQVAFQVESPALAGQNVSVEVALLSADGTILEERKTGGGPGMVPARRSATLAFGPQGLTGKAAAQFPYSGLSLPDGQHQLTIALTARAGGAEASHTEPLQLRVPVRGPIDDMILVDASGNTGRLGEQPATPPEPGGELDESLLSAATRGDAEAVQKLLFQGANVLHIGAGGRTALHLAAEGGHLEAARILASAPPPDSPRQNPGEISDDSGGLFSNNYDPDKPATERDDAAFEDRLKAMSFDSYMEDVERVLATQDDAGLTPLHLAVAGGHFDVADLLVGMGAGLETADQTGMTALHAAAVTADDALCALLLAKGASPYARNNAGQTPLDLAGSEALKRRLKGALDKLANDPEHTAARQVVLAFLGAVKRGDAARARQLVTPEQAERLPAQMAPSSFEMEVLSTEQYGKEAQVVVWTQVADLPSQCKEFKTTYVLRRFDENWLIAESQTLPFVAALDRAEEDR